MIATKARPLTSRSFRAGLRFCTLKASDGVDQPEHLKRFVLQKIRATGAITVAQFMKEVLANPAYGYYITREMFGRTGDFVTSPEISQMFGEMIAVWLVNEWAKVGSPKPLNLVELGPGRASMMVDMLRTFDQLKLQSSLIVHLVEISDSLCKLQAESLCTKVQRHDLESNFYMSGETKFGVKVFWYKKLQDVDMTRFSLVVAHEFFDALPVHKFQRTPRGWREIMIDIDYNDSSGEKLKYVLSPGPTVMSQALISKSETRDHLEISPESILTMEYLADKLERYGGIALVIDYGHNGNKTDTFRAYRSHQQCDPLTNIGSTDLTADVDFAALKKAVGSKLISFGPVTQRQFLQQMMMEVRMEMLLQNCKDAKQKELLKDGFKMLTDEDKMGCSFHFVAFFPAVLEKLLQRFPSVGFLTS